MVPFRGWDYYLSDTDAVMRVLNSKKDDKGVVQSRVRQEFFDAAMRGEDVLALAKTSWVCLPFHVWRSKITLAHSTPC